MRINGTLAKWNDDRGFGFIAPAQGGSEVFVHVSTFPRDGQRPRVGERLSFEIETGKNGKKRATNLGKTRDASRNFLKMGMQFTRPTSPQHSYIFDNALPTLSSNQLDDRLENRSILSAAHPTEKLKVLDKILISFSCILTPSLYQKCYRNP